LLVRGGRYKRLSPGTWEKVVEGRRCVVSVIVL
jgi:hypothetical protein